MIEPTVGRVVWLRPHPDSGIATYGGQPIAALVTHVHSSRMVNLVAFSMAGVPVGLTSVPLRQEGDDVPAWSFCEWMPYQVGQAKKHEADKAT